MHLVRPGDTGRVVTARLLSTCGRVMWREAGRLLQEHREAARRAGAPAGGRQPLSPAEGRDWPTDSRCVGFHILQLRFSAWEGQKHPAEIEEGEKEPLSELDSAAAQVDHRRAWGVSARGLPLGGPCCRRRVESAAPEGPAVRSERS